jgi:hypothetical protein
VRRNPGVQDRSEITDDPGSLLDRFGGEEAKPGLGAGDAIRFVRRCGWHDLENEDANEAGRAQAKPLF